MCPINLLKNFIIPFVICALLNGRQRHAEASPANNRQVEHNHLRNNNPRFSPRIMPQAQFSRVRQEPFTDFLGDDDDLFDMIKRQSDDYGHMRFGKREFDDYGHMRFGKSVPEK